MKVGDSVEVNIGSAVVQRGKIVEVDTESSTATIVIPATKVVMSFKTQLDTSAPQAETNQHAILGLENESGTDTPVHESALAAEATDGDVVESKTTVDGAEVAAVQNPDESTTGDVDAQ